jgi:preprotein translocase subunit YajC
LFEVALCFLVVLFVFLHRIIFFSLIFSAQQKQQQQQQEARQSEGGKLSRWSS